mmetsp:Transcript_30189/g.34561  ORF Transcript_30189/g.34561 Transcript_30189/m.34561 type:complete len:150 (-) Transcript_30189:64-513(-)
MKVYGVYDQLDVGLILVTFISFVYIYIEPVTGVTSAVIYNLMYYFGMEHWKVHRDDTDFICGVSYFSFLLYLQGFAWITQFVGHGVFEKRAPALLSNLLTVFVAPDFVVIEIFYFLGYNKKAIDECQVIIDKDIAEFWKSKEKAKIKSQ